MSVPRYAYPRDTHEFEKKLKQHHPVRSLVMNLVGFFTVVGVVSIALMVAFSPGMRYWMAAHNVGVAKGRPPRAGLASAIAPSAMRRSYSATLDSRTMHK